MESRHTRAIAKLTVLVVMLALMSSAALANVVVFEKYDTTATIEGGSITIERDMRIKNVGKAPIIPGELHFRLYQRKGDNKVPIPVVDLSAVSGRGEDIGTKIVEKSDETALSVQLWNPLLPGFHYDFTMKYELKFKPSGIFFYELRLPQEETTIPIVNEETNFVLDDGFHITYAPEGDVSKLSGNVIVTWDETNTDRVVEYSRIPLPRTGIRAVNIFWVLIIVILAGYFILSVRRQRRGSGGFGGGGPVQSYNPYQQQQAPPQQPYYPPHPGHPPRGRR